MSFTKQHLPDVEFAHDVAATVVDAAGSVVALVPDGLVETVVDTVSEGATLAAGASRRSAGAVGRAVDSNRRLAIGVAAVAVVAIAVGLVIRSRRRDEDLQPPVSIAA